MFDKLFRDIDPGGNNSGENNAYAIERTRIQMLTNTNNAYAIINNQQYYYPHGNSYYARTPLDIVLNAGDTVKSSTTTSDYSMILGVESDA